MGSIALLREAEALQAEADAARQLANSFTHRQTVRDLEHYARALEHWVSDANVISFALARTQTMRGSSAR